MKQDEQDIYVKLEGSSISPVLQKENVLPLRTTWSSVRLWVATHKTTCSITSFVLIAAIVATVVVVPVVLTRPTGSGNVVDNNYSRNLVQLVS